MAPDTPYPPGTASLLPIDARDRDCELYDGVPCVKEASGGESPFVSFDLTATLGAHVRGRRLGWGGDSRVGFLLRRSPDRVLSPDIAYVSFAKMASPPRRGFAEVVPDFVVEVRSPEQSLRDRMAKCLSWSEHGVQVVWLVDPIERRVTVIRRDRAPETFGPGGVANAAPALPDFSVVLADLFRLRGGSGKDDVRG